MRSYVGVISLVAVLVFSVGCNCNQALIKAGSNTRIAFSSGAENIFNDGLLFAAGEGEDDGLGMEMDTPTTPPKRPTVEKEARRKYFMLRVGAVAPSSGDNATYSPSGSFGLGFEAPFMHSETIGLEASFDQVKLKADDAAETSEGTILTGTLRIAPGGKALYIAGVASLYNETVTDSDTGEELATNAVMLIGGGVGYRPFGKSYDLRATLNLIPGSENSTGLLSLTGGFRF